jgi:hypothetical protein
VPHTQSHLCGRGMPPAVAAAAADWLLSTCAQQQHGGAASTCCHAGSGGCEWCCAALTGARCRSASSDRGWQAVLIGLKRCRELQVGFKRIMADTAAACGLWGCATASVHTSSAWSCVGLACTAVVPEELEVALMDNAYTGITAHSSAGAAFCSHRVLPRPKTSSKRKPERAPRCCA